VYLKKEVKKTSFFLKGVIKHIFSFG